MDSDLFSVFEDTPSESKKDVLEDKAGGPTPSTAASTTSR